MTDRIQGFEREVMDVMEDPNLTMEERLFKADRMIVQGQAAMKGLVEEGVAAALKARSEVVDPELDGVPESGDAATKKKKMRKALNRLRAKTGQKV